MEMLVLGVGIGWLSIGLWELRARRQRWRVQRAVKLSEYDSDRTVVAFYLAKGGESAKVTTVGVNRKHSARPDKSFDDAMTEAIVEARVKRDVLNATDRNLQQHG